MVLLFALAALGLSYLVNKWMLRFFKEYAVIFGAPVFEELFKTLPAYYWNRPVLVVHFLFGIGEALYDFSTRSKESGKWAAVFSIISHSAFGMVTDLTLKHTGRIIPAMLATMAIHCIWNWVIMRVGKKDRESC